MNLRNFFRDALLATALAALVAPAPTLAQAAPAKTTVAASAEKIKNGAIPNLGRIHDNLYRGGQPEAAGYAELKKLGIGLVINFREDSKDKEKSQVEALGMTYIDIPWNAFHNPTSQQVAQFLQLLRDNADKKVFFHCRRGAERTGVMTAAYRIAVERWTPQQALDEMEQFKFRGLFFRNLKKYVRNFPQQLESDPVMQPFKPK